MKFCELEIQNYYFHALSAARYNIYKHVFSAHSDSHQTISSTSWNIYHKYYTNKMQCLICSWFYEIIQPNVEYFALKIIYHMKINENSLVKMLAPYLTPSPRYRLKCVQNRSLAYTQYFYSTIPNRIFSNLLGWWTIPRAFFGIFSKFFEYTVIVKYEF